jgi:helix-turn-helix protein
MKGTPISSISTFHKLCIQHFFNHQIKDKIFHSPYERTLIYLRLSLQRQKEKKRNEKKEKLSMEKKHEKHM